MQRDGVISHQKEATMRFTYITVAAVCAVMLAVPVLAKEKKADKAMDQQAMMELWKKAAAVPAARWHLIGHLQRNKLDRTVPLVALVHSVDSERLLAALDAFGRARGVPVPVLLEVNCSGEAAKGGFAPADLPALGDTVMSRAGVAVRGLMTMAAYSDDPEAARPTFAALRTLRDDLRARTGLALPDLSMGMSGDFEVGVEEGATFVRVGSTLFDGLGR